MNNNFLCWSDEKKFKNLLLERVHWVANVPYLIMVSLNIVTFRWISYQEARLRSTLFDKNYKHFISFCYLILACNSVRLQAAKVILSFESHCCHKIKLIKCTRFIFLKVQLARVTLMLWIYHKEPKSYVFSKYLNPSLITKPFFILPLKT